MWLPKNFFKTAYDVKQSSLPPMMYCRATSKWIIAQNITTNLVAASDLAIGDNKNCFQVTKQGNSAKAGLFFF